MLPGGGGAVEPTRKAGAPPSGHAPAPALPPKVAAIARLDSAGQAPAKTSAPKASTPSPSSTYVSPAEARFGPIDGVTVSPLATSTAKGGGGGSSIFGDIGNFLTNSVPHFFTHTLPDAGKTALTGIDNYGKGVSHLGSIIQTGVNDAGSWVNGRVASAANAFEHSPFGNNPVGHFLGTAAKDYSQFQTGVVSGATTLVSGALKLGGGSYQYLTNSKFRNDFNSGFSKTGIPILAALSPGANISPSPTVVKGDMLVAGIAQKGIHAFEQNPFHAAGEVVGVVGSTVATGGIGAGGDAAGGIAVAGDAARVAGDVTDGLTATGDALRVTDGVGTATGDAGTVPGDAGTAGTAADKLPIPEGATNVQRYGPNSFSFVKDGKLYVANHDNYSVLDGAPDQLRTQAALKTLNGRGYVPSVQAGGQDIRIFGANDAQFAKLSDVVKSLPPQVAARVRSFYVVDRIGMVGSSPTSMSLPITGFAGDGSGTVLLSKAAFENGNDLGGTVAHEIGHNLDAATGLSTAAGSPFGKAPFISAYSQSSPGEDVADTSAQVVKMLQAGAREQGDPYAYIRPALYGPYGAKIEQVLHAYGMQPWIDLRLTGG